MSRGPVRRSPSACSTYFTTVTSEIEIRQVFEAEDFGAEFTPELREREERLRETIEKQGKK